MSECAEQTSLGWALMDKNVLVHILKYLIEEYEDEDHFLLCERKIETKYWHSIFLTSKLWCQAAQIAFDPSSNNNEAIIWATANKKHQCLRYLLNDPRVDPDPALLICCSSRDHIALELLILDPRLSDYVFYKGLEVCFSSGFKDIIQKIEQHRPIQYEHKNWLLLQHASCAGNLDLIKHIFSQTIQKGGRPAISESWSLAIEMGREEVIEFYAEEAKRTQFSEEEIGALLHSATNRRSEITFACFEKVGINFDRIHLLPIFIQSAKPAKQIQDLINSSDINPGDIDTSHLSLCLSLENLEIFDLLWNSTKCSPTSSELRNLFNFWIAGEPDIYRKYISHPKSQSILLEKDKKKIHKTWLSQQKQQE